MAIVTSLQPNYSRRHKNSKYEKFHCFYRVAMANSVTTPKPQTTPEGSTKGSIHGTLFPELMGIQQTFLLYGGLIFVLFVFCVILLILHIKTRNRFVNKY